MKSCFRFFQILFFVFCFSFVLQVSASDFGNFSAGYFHTCGIKTDGTVACWGRDDDKQSTPKTGTFIAIGWWFHHTCGIKTDGTAACWGRNADSQSIVPIGVTFTQITSGLYHTCGIKTDGTVACWGRNDYGQLTSPSTIFTQIWAWVDFTCGLKTNGTIQCWGKNDVGQVNPPAGTFTQIGVGYTHACGLRTNGAIDCWGNTDYGKAVSQTGIFVQVWAGIDHSCWLKADGTIQCWGRNNFGQRNTLPGSFFQISVGSNHVCGIRPGGLMECWGRNDYGQSTVPAGLVFKSIDKTSFSLLSSLPHGGSTGVNINPSIVLNFSKVIDQSTVPGNIVLQKTDGAVVGTMASSYAGGTIVFAPTSPLLKNTNYTVSVYTGLKSTGGKNITSAYSFSFTTAAEPTSPSTNIPLASTSLSYMCSISGISFAHPECNPLNAPIITSNNAIVQNDAATTSIVWDPVSLETGDFTYSNTLMRVPGDGMDYDFSLSYKSQTYSNGPVGMNWDHSYNISLRENDDSSVTYFDGKFGVYTFSKTSTGAFTRLPWLRADLVKMNWTQGSAYELRFADGTIQVFGANLKIASIRDANSHELTFVYDTENELIRTTDTLGRIFTYAYYGHGRLRLLTDPTGRSVTFNYYQDSDTGGSTYDLRSIVIQNPVDFSLDPGAPSPWPINKTISFTYQKDTTEILSHNILTLTDSSGAEYVKNTYDTNDRVISQKFGDGTLIYSYETVGGTGSDANHVTKTTATNKRGMKSEFNYDANGNTISKKLFEGTWAVTTIYTYGSGGKVATETKPLGNGITYLYDQEWRIIEKRLKSDMAVLDNDAIDLVTRFEYQAGFQTPIKTIDSVGNVTLTTLDIKGNIIESKKKDVQKSDGTFYDITTSFAYDMKGHLITKIDGEGNETHYEYGSWKLLKTIEGTGSESVAKLFSYDTHGNLVSTTDGEGNTKTFSFDQYDRLIRSISAEWIREEASYDANNNKIEQRSYLENNQVLRNQSTYDILDQVIGTTLGESGSINARATSMVRDANGNIIQSTDVRWLKTVFVYDIFDRVIEKRIITDPLDQAKDLITKIIYDQNGNIIQSTDPRNHATVYEYDGFDRPIITTDAIGTKIILTYDKVGNTIKTEIKDASGAILSKTERTYDSLGQILTETSGNIASGSILATIRTDYDRNGKPIRTLDPKGNLTTLTYDSLGRKKTVTDSLGNQTILTYDKRGLPTKQELRTADGKTIFTTSQYDRDARKTRTTDSLGNTTFSLPNKLGQITRITDANNNKTDFTYDLFGNLLTETKYLSGAISTPLVTSYEYDKNNNRTKLIDANGNITTYEYDLLNRLTKETLADNSFVEYEYDKNGNVTKKTDANGTIVTNEYDSLNRLTKRTIVRGVNILGVTEENYTYDPLGHLIATTDSAGNILAFTYDSLGRLLSENNSGALVSYEYDANNNRTKLIYPDVRESHYTYDSLNRVTSISQNGTPIATYAYTGIANTGISYGNNTTISQTFDELSRLKALNAGVKSYVYTYDPIGNITTDAHKNYTYDSISRLTQINDTNSGTILEDFNYDKMGSRTTDTSNEYTTNVLNQYTSLTWAIQSNYTYDANGNLTNNGIFLFSYDYKNRLIQVKNVSDASLVTEYQYDILGRRIEKKTNTETTQYVYDGQDIISETRIHSGATLQKTYINGLWVDNLIAYDQEEIDINNTGSIITNRYYFHKDHLWSIIGITDNTGITVSTYIYDAFWKSHLTSGIDTGNTRLFTGREYDSETGLYYYRARYYSAELGRFISRDPIGTTDDVNLYGYVGNNPVMFSDPMGKEKILIFWWEEYYDYERHDWKDAFKKKAEAYRSHLIKNWAKAGNIIVLDGSSGDKWKTALEKYKNIKRITYYGHSWGQGLLLSDATPYEDSDNHDDNINMIYLDNYNGSQEGDMKISNLPTNNAMWARFEIAWCNSYEVSKALAKQFQWIGWWSTSTINYKSEITWWVEFIPYVDWWKGWFKTYFSNQ